MTVYTAVGDGGGVGVGGTAVAVRVGEGVAECAGEGVKVGTLVLSAVKEAVAVTGNVPLATCTASGVWQAASSHKPKQLQRQKRVKVIVVIVLRVATAVKLPQPTT